MVKKNYPISCEVLCRKRPLKEGNHEEHEEHKEELFFSFVAFVSFVVQGFYAFCDNPEDGATACGISVQG